jgi:hypothetical protein
MKTLPLQRLQQQRQQLLEQLQQLPPLRRGSISQQYVAATRKDGTPVKRGPYFIYTCKDAHQKTVSRYLREPAEIQLYQQQIDAFRQFQALTKQLLTVSEQLSAAALQPPATLKKTPASKSNSKPQ